jgi:hypothetical protein
MKFDQLSVYILRRTAISDHEIEVERPVDTVHSGLPQPRSPRRCNGIVPEQVCRDQDTRGGVEEDDFVEEGATCEGVRLITQMGRFYLSMPRRGGC